MQGNSVDVGGEMDQGYGVGWEPDAESVNSARPVSIVYLDDDPLDRKMFQLSLRKVNSDLFDLICVGEIDEARDVLANRSVDFFITDNRLDLISSFRDTLEALEDLAIAGKIIVVSGETDSIFAADHADLVHAPDMIRDKCDFFSDLRAIGLDALDEQKSETHAQEKYRCKSLRPIVGGTAHLS